LPRIVANTRDVTVRERILDELRESERRFRGIFDSSRDAIVIATPDDGQIVDVNSAYSRIYGYSRDQALGKDPHELALFANPEDYCRLSHEVVERGAVGNFEADLRARDGRIVPTLLSSVLVDLGVGVRVVSILRDVSERRAADIELARARDAALESARLKSAFLANTSHEIRTPLNVILGYTDLLGEHLADIGDHTQDAYLEALGRAGRRLLTTIQQILDYSRLEAGALAFSPSAIALAPFIEDQVNDLNLLAAEKGLKLRLDIAESDATVRFDEYCLQSALTNLLDNAIKFTDRGEIVLGLNRDSSGTLNLEVRDTGIGIDTDYLPRLFEPFSQEQAGHSRRFEGAGLGLAFARKCVELGGARISAASRKGEGSTFTIAFPRACEIRRRRT
jgi:PAS domain S-box-containing protein